MIGERNIMAEIKMSYIFIEKEKHESKTMQEILLEIVDNVVRTRDEHTINIDKVDVKYRVIQKKNSKRCFFEMTTSERITRTIPALKKVDEALFKSSQQRYYHAIRDYAGISENFCKRLYPKYAEFERKLRSLILFIVTKAYGSNWQTATVSKELLRALQENAHGNVSLNETLENMDLSTLEEYLFKQRHVDYPCFIREKLNVKYLEKLEKEEICAIIDEMRPTSLWQRHFEKFGSQECWMKKIVDVHATRNKVAHQKTISLDEFNSINKKLNNINRDLTKTIEGIREENFTEYRIVDVLGSFADIVGNMTKSIAQSQAFKDVVISFNEKIQEILKPMADIYKSSMVDCLNSIEQTYAKLNWGFVQPETIKGINSLANSFSVTNAIANKFTATQALADSLTFTKALSCDFSTSQMIEKNIKTTGIIQNTLDDENLKG